MQRDSMRVRPPEIVTKYLSCALNARTKRTMNIHRSFSIELPGGVSPLLSADQTAYTLRKLKHLECEDRRSSGRALCLYWRSRIHYSHLDTSAVAPLRRCRLKTSLPVNHPSEHIGSIQSSPELIRCALDGVRNNCSLREHKRILLISRPPLARVSHPSSACFFLSCPMVSGLGPEEVGA